MKKYFFAIGCLMFSLVTKAQLKTLNNNQISLTIHKTLKANYKPDSAVVSKICSKGCVFATFSVKNKNGISGLSFSKGSDTSVIKAITPAILSLNNNVLLIKTLRTNLQTVIIPIIYEYTVGCDVPPVYLPNATKEEKYKDLLFYLKKQMASDHYTNIYNMLNFDDDNKEAIGGILIKPFVVGATKDPGY